MKELTKQLFSEIRATIHHLNYVVEKKHGDWATLMGEIVIVGLVITIIIGIASVNSILGIIVAGIIVLILIAGFRNPIF